MVTIPELLIEKVLTQGFDSIRKNPALIQDILKDYSPVFQQEGLNYMSKHKVTVVQNWPRDPGMTLPIVSIINAQSEEDVSKDVMGDIMGRDVPEDSDVNILERYGFADRGTWNCFISSQEPRLTIYLSMFVKAFLFINRLAFLENGMEEMKIGTSDLKFEEAMLPEMQNPRVVSLSALVYFTVPETTAILRQLVVTVTPVVNPPEDEAGATLFLPDGTQQVNP